MYCFSVAESWNRYPFGILAGNTYHMGMYDECVNVHDLVKGQYCLTEVHLTPSVGKMYSFDSGTENVAWKTILGVR